ncbi:MAG TPA: hypothetical protein VN300_09610, partial [Desulfobacterales bacterium]|nr:hypothetical protein [Desulfobacterales bacterium]
MFSESFEHLMRVNPGVAAFVSARLAAEGGAFAADRIELLVEETLWALDVEASFGRSVAAGYAELIGTVGPAGLDAYRSCVRQAGAVGATQGAIMADCLPPVLIHGDADLLGRFHQAWAAMAGKGSYALRAPLEALGLLLKSGDRGGAAAYLDSLAETFRRELSYEEARYFTGA